MKIKTSIIILALSIPITARGASMCVPPTTGWRVYSRTGDDAYNRGQWTIGGNCVEDEDSKTVVCTTAPDYRGESHCSILDDIQAYEFVESWDDEEMGWSCWCRLTGIKSTNGYLAPYNGGWVFLFSFDGCDEDCGIKCANYFDMGYYDQFVYSLLLTKPWTRR